MEVPTERSWMHAPRISSHDTLSHTASHAFPVTHRSAGRENRRRDIDIGYAPPRAAAGAAASGLACFVWTLTR